MRKKTNKRPEKLWLSEDHLRVLSGSRTQDVFDCFSSQSALSASEIQARLGFPSKAVYYQLRKLDAAGLIRPVVEEGRSVRYERAASSISMPTGFQGVEYERLAAGNVAARLRSTMRQFEKTAQRSGQEPELVDWLYVFAARLQLKPDRFKELKRRLDSLVMEYSREPDEGAKPVKLLVVSTPELS